MAAFPAPPPDQFSYLHFSHVSFAVSDGTEIVVIDPFFSGEFEWQGRIERHLQPPTIAPTAVTPLSTVLISHEHRDHWDPESLPVFLDNCRDAYAPRKTVADIAAAGIDAGKIRAVDSGMSVEIGRLTVSFHPSIESEDQRPPDRVGFLCECDGQALYHQGDSHGPAAAWQAFAARLDALIIWPVYMDAYIYRLRPPNIILHHLDHFEPGNFFCSLDPQRELDYWRYRHPDVNFIVPPRNEWLPVPRR
jgi:L-ascorbate metabolism protein UlaG (beta-lactamase superfamily)